MLDTTEKLLKIFADKNRLRIFCLLRQRKMCVCELAFVLGVTQPSVSRHLKKMKSSGLVGVEQDGFWTNYFLVKDPHRGGGLIREIYLSFKNDKAIKADRERFKKADRTKLCCR